MAKGSEAKVWVAQKLAETLGSRYLGEYDKKYYVLAREGGEDLQIAISMTCPKNPVEVVQTGDYDFTDESVNTAVASTTPFEPAEITQEEKDTIEDIMKRLGL